MNPYEAPEHHPEEKWHCASFLLWAFVWYIGFPIMLILTIYDPKEVDDIPLPVQLLGQVLGYIWVGAAFWGPILLIIGWCVSWLS